MTAKRQRVDFAPRRPDAPLRGQVARGVIPPGVKVTWVGGQSLVFSSMLSGHDDESPSYELPKEVEREVEVLFRHIGGFVEKAGGKLKDLVNVTFFTMDDAYRDVIEKEWSKMFPDEGHRPPRHTLNVAPSGLRGERVQAVVVAQMAG